MTSRRTNPSKPTKDVARPKPARKPRPTRAVVKDLRTGIQDLQAIDPEHPWAKLLKEAVAAIREANAAHLTLGAVASEGFAKVLDDSRVGMIQFRGELERIEEQLAAINERLKARTRDERFVYHGRVFTVENFAKEVDSIVGKVEKAAAERCEKAEAIAARKNVELAELQFDLARLRAEIQAARTPQPPPVGEITVANPPPPLVLQFDLVP